MRPIVPGLEIHARNPRWRGTSPLRITPMRQILACDCPVQETAERASANSDSHRRCCLRWLKSEAY